jgi:hypothetical protein
MLGNLAHKKLFSFLTKAKSIFLQILFWGTYWLRFWTQLQHLDEHRTSIVKACSLLVGGVSLIILGIKSGSLVFIFDVSL